MCRPFASTSANFNGLKLAFIGDGNNVAHSLMLTSLRLGMDFALGCPSGYTPNPDIVAQAEGLAAVSGASLLVTHDPSEAVDGAHAVYTDVWASMGQEQEAVERKPRLPQLPGQRRAFRSGAPDAVFMHCLPAKRGEEVTDAVMESHALRGVRPGRKPAARAEGAAADDALVALRLIRITIWAN